jgi:putative ABC transport system permease protein
VSGGRSNRLREVLVVAEIGFSVVLLAGAGLLIKSFVALNNVALGFRPERVLLMKASWPAAGPEEGRRARNFFKQLPPDFLSLPGVSAVGATMGPPGDVESAGGYWIDHLPERIKSDTPDAVFSVVVLGTFAALGIPLRRRRDLEERDAADAPYTAVINEALARRAFPGQDPIGRNIFAGFDSFDKPMKIVGIVGDVRQWGPARKPEPEIYMPYDQHTSGAGATLNVVVRTSAAPEALTNTLRRRVQELSPDVPLKFTTMKASLYEEVAVPRFRTLLLAIFAGLALCLAMAGVYGVTAYAVGQRSNEIGLRMAMGAAQRDVLRLIFKQGMRLAAVGMALGFLGALAGTRLMTSMLFDVAPEDPGTYAGVAALLGLMVLSALYLPARRAAHLDPLAALRQE